MGSRVGVEGTVAVVIADSVGGGKIGYPAGFQQRNQPGLVLAGNGDGSGHGHREGAALADGMVEDGVDAPEKGSAERGETVRDEFAERVAFVDAFDFNW